jgi:hypothetical protein
MRRFGAVAAGIDRLCPFPLPGGGRRVYGAEVAFCRAGFTAKLQLWMWRWGHGSSTLQLPLTLVCCKNLCKTINNSCGLLSESRIANNVRTSARVERKGLFNETTWA